MAAASAEERRKITRLKREIEKIDRFFYPDSDDEHRLWRLQLKRDDMVRALVLQLHTSIEDLLNIRIMNRILVGQNRKTARNNAARSLRKLLEGAGSIGFERKLNLAVAIGLINLTTERRLAELNRLRNRCSHNWRLNVRLRRGRKPKDKKLPLLRYQGHDLHKAEVLQQFGTEYANLHAMLYLLEH